MKRVLLVFTFVLALTGCRYLGYTSFDGGSNLIDGSNSIKDVFEMLMDRGDHSTDFMVPADLVLLHIGVQDDTTGIGDVGYYVYLYSKDNKLYYEPFACTNRDSEFTCSAGGGSTGFEYKMMYDISLGEVIHLFSTYDSNYLLTKISQRYNMDFDEWIYLDYGFESLDYETLDIDNMENTYLIKDNLLIDHGVESVSSLLLKIEMSFYVEEEKERITVYIDYE